MFQCGDCGKKFTRKDNVVRHLKKVCNVAHSPQQVDCDSDQELKVATSSNDNADIAVDFIEILTIALSEQRRKWKKDFEKFKNEIKHIPKETSEDENDGKDNASTDEDNVSTD